MASVVWVCINANQAKVWGYDIFGSVNPQIDETEVIYYWGSLGRTMQQLTQKRINYNNYWDAYDAVSDKMDEKERKGYIRVPNGAFFEVTSNYHERLQELADELKNEVIGEAQYG